jgi:hypothetical protein
MCQVLLQFLQTYSCFTSSGRQKSTFNHLTLIEIPISQCPQKAISLYISLWRWLSFLPRLNSIPEIPPSYGFSCRFERANSFLPRHVPRSIAFLMFPYDLNKWAFQISVSVSHRHENHSLVFSLCKPISSFTCFYPQWKKEHITSFTFDASNDVVPDESRICIATPIASCISSNSDTF